MNLPNPPLCPLPPIKKEVPEETPIDEPKFLDMSITEDEEIKTVNK
tara:strand:+ start:4680 stop:4817 length:138 start_codon:yes stop_codon:yes gene_type:complete